MTFNIQNVKIEVSNLYAEHALAPYLGREVIASLTNATIFGLFESANFDEGYANFRPSIVFEADDMHAYVEREIPTRVSLSTFEKKGDYVIRPLKTGFLEERVKIINRLADKKSGTIGFVSDEKPLFPNAKD